MKANTCLVERALPALRKGLEIVNSSLSRELDSKISFEGFGDRRAAHWEKALDSERTGSLS